MSKVLGWAVATYKQINESMFMREGRIEPAEQSEFSEASVTRDDREFSKSRVQVVVKVGSDADVLDAWDLADAALTAEYPGCNISPRDPRV